MPIAILISRDGMSNVKYCRQASNFRIEEFMFYYHMAMLISFEFARDKTISLCCIRYNHIDALRNPLSADETTIQSFHHFCIAYTLNCAVADDIFAGGKIRGEYKVSVGIW